jgi:hypothetical protein
MYAVPEVQAGKPVVRAIVRRIDPDGLLAVGDGLDEASERGERGRLVAPVRRAAGVHDDGLVVERHRLRVVPLAVLLVAHLLELVGVRAVRQRPAQLAPRCSCRCRPGLPDDVPHAGGRVPVGRLPLVRRPGAAARVQVAEVAVQHHVARGGAHQLRGALDPLVVEDHPVQLRGHAAVLRRRLRGGRCLGGRPAPAVLRRRRHGHGAGAAREGGVAVRGGLLVRRRRGLGLGPVDPVEGGHGRGAAAAEHAVVDAEQGAAGRRVARLRHGDHDRGDVRGRAAPARGVLRGGGGKAGDDVGGSAKDGEAARWCAGRLVLVDNQRGNATTTGSGHGVGMWGARGFLKFSVSSPIIFSFFFGYA